MGAKIDGIGTPHLEIVGVDELHTAQHTVIPDRIEAATLLIAAAITGGSIRVENIEASHLTSVIEVLREIGVSIELQPGACEVRVVGQLRPVDCWALPYPGFPTDVQAQLTALLSWFLGRAS